MSGPAPAGVVVRPDAGPACGLGHLRRCLAVAAELRALDVAVLLLVPPGAPASLAAAEGFAVEEHRAEPGSDADRDGVLAAAARSGARTVLADSYAVDAPWLSALRDGAGGAAGGGPALRVAAFDDLCRWPHPADLVANGGLGAQELPYAAAPGGATEFLLGAGYAPLRPGFAGGGAPAPPPAGPPRVLVTAGGADALSLVPRFLRALDLVGTPLLAIAVVGPLATNHARVEGAARSVRHDVEVAVAPPDLPALVRTVTVAVSAGGGSLVELAAAGVPAVAVEAASNQRRGIAALVRAGAAVPAGAATDPAPGLEQAIAARVAALLVDPARRARLAAAGRSLVDGQGARRIAERIAALARR